MSRLARQPENGPRAYSSVDCPRPQRLHSLTNWPLQPLLQELSCNDQLLGITAIRMPRH